jgi:hypothetical protein
MHTALVSRLLKDRSAWELAHVPVPSSAELTAPANLGDKELAHPALQGA